jgi:hypothetical protein
MEKVIEKQEDELARILDMFEVWFCTLPSIGEKALANWYGMGREHYEQFLAYYAGYMAGKKDEQGIG